MKKKLEISAKFAITVYRFGNWIYYFCHIPIFRQLLLLIYKLINFIFLKLIMGIDIPASVKIGSGLVIYHPQGIIIHPRVIIGEHVTLRHQITIGNKGTVDTQVPVLGDNVNVGAGAKIIGGVIIGNYVQIGANAVVTKSFPDNSIVVGIPAKKLANQKPDKQ